MKTFIKYAVVGFVGYFVGFYEMKYKAMKAIFMQNMKVNENSEKENKEES